MATYTVKKGDTKSSLKAKYGIDLNDSQYRSKDVNKLYAGEVITLRDLNSNSTSAITSAPQVDLSRIDPAIKPTSEMKQTVPQSQGVSSKTTRREFKDPIPQEVPLSYEEQLMQKRSQLDKEISEVETRMMNRRADQSKRYEDAGIYDDLKQLNELKAKQRAAEDRAIEIPINARKDLRGNQATLTEYEAMTRPKLEDNLLEQLAASRATSTLSEAITTNKAIIDDQIEAEIERDTFEYQKKAEQIASVEKAYSDFMTEKQKVLMEERKFQNDLMLESVKADNLLRKDLIMKIADTGASSAELNDVMNAPIEQLLSVAAQKTSPMNWLGMDAATAYMTLDKDSLARWESFTKISGEQTKAQQEATAQAISTQTSAKSVISTIEAMLNDTKGLKTSVGTNPWGYTDFFNQNDSTQFRAKAKQLISAQTLQTLKDLKASGATLGAVSEKELEILQTAENALSPVYDKNGKMTGQFKISEQEFIKTMRTMRIASMKTYIAATIGSEKFQAANYLNADYATIENRYKYLVENGYKPMSASSGNPAQGLQAAISVIKEEEGLRTKAYQDQTGKWTIGYGNTMINGRPVRPGDQITPQQAEQLMQKSVIQNYTSWASRIPMAVVNPLAFAALTSFEYNLGSGVWNQPTAKQILSHIASGAKEAAARLMLQFNKSRDPKTGSLAVNPVLAKRRMREAQMLLS